MIFSKSFIAAATSKADEPLIDMNMDVYYVVWDRNGERYFLTQFADEDVSRMCWTKHREDGFQFLTSEEAMAVARLAKPARPGVSVDVYEEPILVT